MFRLIFLACLFFSLNGCGTSESAGDSEPYLLLVSFDGFRADYLQDESLANLRWLMDNGTVAEGLVPAYPSKTFPNHYTLVTGLYPGNHGLVDNNFHHPGLGLDYSLADREAVENADFYGGIPLWQLLKNQGIATASYFWVGSEAPILGSYPDYYTLYDGGIPNEVRIAQVFDWLALPESERPRFITLYFSMVDSAAHAYGPESEQVKRTLAEADALVGQLIAGITASRLPVNLVLVSDHGMVEVPVRTERVIPVSTLKPVFEAAGARVVESGTQIHVYLGEQSAAGRLRQQLLPVAENFSVMTRNRLPGHWHYDQSTAAGDLLLVADTGFVFLDEAEDILEEQSPVIGVHGYDPAGNTDLNGIFVAWGPAFRENYSRGLLDNIHVYPLAAHLFDIETPQAIDGRLDAIRDVLKQSHQ